MLAGGDRAGRRGHAAHARLPRRGRDLLRHARHAARSAATASTSARTSPARCAAATSCCDAFEHELGDDPDVNVRALRVPRRLRHRADGQRSTASTSGRSTLDEVPAPGRADPQRRGRRCPTSSSCAGRAPTRPPTATSRRPDRHEPTTSSSTTSTSPASTRSRSTSAAAATRRCARRWRCSRSRSPTSCWRPTSAAAAAPASRWARRSRSCRPGTMDKYLVCNADESEPGHVQGPRAHAEEPAHADRGHHHRRLRGRRDPLVHLHPRRVRAAGRHPRRGAARGGLRGRLPRASTSSARASPQPRGAPRRGRLHLRRGDGAARLARGQARQPAPEAAVPRQPGPLPGPDAHQQRRDADDRPAHHADGRRGVREDRRRRARPARSSSPSRATSSARATTRSSSGSPRARSSTASPAARRTGARSSSGSPAARARRSSRRTTSTSPYDFDSMAKAGSMLGSGAIIVVDDSVLGRRRRLQDREVLRATSPAASARPAARAPAGP